MKTFFKMLVVLFALALMYFVIVDGMMTIFGLSQAVQYAFNFGAVLIGIPACIICLFDDLERICWS